MEVIPVGTPSGVGVAAAVITGNATGSGVTGGSVTGVDIIGSGIAGAAIPGSGIAGSGIAGSGTAKVPVRRSRGSPAVGGVGRAVRGGRLDRGVEPVESDGLEEASSALEVPAGGVRLVDDREVGRPIGVGPGGEQLERPLDAAGSGGCHTGRCVGLV